MGPSKTIPILDMTSHIQKQETSELVFNRDWNLPSCSRCYYKYLKDAGARDSWACSGRKDNKVCVDYSPPNTQAVREANQSMLEAFVALDELEEEKQEETLECDCPRCKPRIH